MKTPTRIRELRRVTSRGTFPVFIVGLSFRLDTNKRFNDLMFSRMVADLKLYYDQKRGKILHDFARAAEILCATLLNVKGSLY